MERKKLQQLLASAQQELNRLTTKQKALTRKEKTHKKIVLGGEVAKYMGLDIDHDVLVGFLLTWARKTEEDHKRYLSNGARARQLQNMRKEQKNKNSIKKMDNEKPEAEVPGKKQTAIQPDTVIEDSGKDKAPQLNNTFSAMLEKQLTGKKNKNE